MRLHAEMRNSMLITETDLNRLRKAINATRRFSRGIVFGRLPRPGLMATPPV